MRRPDMAKKKAGGRKVPASAEQTETRHARIELDEPDYERLRAVAKQNGLSIAAYIRQAVLRQVRRDEAEGEG
jgi:hypothetical protein